MVCPSHVVCVFAHGEGVRAISSTFMSSTQESRHSPEPSLRVVAAAAAGDVACVDAVDTVDDGVMDERSSVFPVSFALASVPGTNTLVAGVSVVVRDGAFLSFSQLSPSSPTLASVVARRRDDSRVRRRVLAFAEISVASSNSSSSSISLASCAAEGVEGGRRGGNGSPVASPSPLCNAAAFNRRYDGGGVTMLSAFANRTSPIQTQSKERSVGCAAFTHT